jgi:heptosyltransferase-2
MLRDAGWDGRAPLVALAPGAAYGTAKRWPSERFAALAASLVADGVQSVMIGAAADRPTADEVSRAFRSPSLLTLVGRTDLPALAGVLATCRALVTNDSGAMHLAAAVGTSVTAVFGPTDERATRPLGDAHQVVTFPVWCRPCMLRECPLDHRCMRGVDAEAVVAAARRTL